MQLWWLDIIVMSKLPIHKVWFCSCLNFPGNIYTSPWIREGICNERHNVLVQKISLPSPQGIHDFALVSLKFVSTELFIYHIFVICKFTRKLSVIFDWYPFFTALVTVLLFLKYSLSIRSYTRDYSWSNTRSLATSTGCFSTRTTTFGNRICCCIQGRWDIPWGNARECTSFEWWHAVYNMC